MHVWTCLLIFLVTTLSTTVAYRDGARNESCYTQEVVHNNNFGIPVAAIDCDDPCSYILTVEGMVDENFQLIPNEYTTYECGRMYQLNISYEINAFEGFLVQARDVSGSFDDSSSIYGTFYENETLLYKPLNCGENQDNVTITYPNSATQRNPVNLEDYILLYWKAPDPMDDFNQLPMNITFWFTIVQQHMSFFNPIEGPTLTRDDESCTVPITTTEAPETTIETTQQTTSETTQQTTSETTQQTTSEPDMTTKQTTATSSAQPTTVEDTTVQAVTTVTMQDSGPGLNSEERRAVGVGVGIGVPLLIVLIILIGIAIFIGERYFNPKRGGKRITNKTGNLWINN